VSNHWISGYTKNKSYKSTNQWLFISHYIYIHIYIYIYMYSVITCVIIDQWFKIINQPVNQDLAIRPPQTSRQLRKERRNPLEVQRPRTPGMEVGSRSSEVGWSSEGAKCLWLVVDLCWPTPLKNAGVRQIGSSSQLLGKIRNVLNHQPYIYIQYITCFGQYYNIYDKIAIPKLTNDNSNISIMRFI